MSLLLIAPCGMNCGICMAYLRDKNICSSCWSTSGYKSDSCKKCSIKNCELLAKTDSKFCYECSKFPCARLKQLDKRYRLKYKMSMIENLHYIEESGVENFVQKESIRWKCETCGGPICVHRGFCLKCNNKSAINN
jgi:ribosomal protein L40E